MKLLAREIATLVNGTLSGNENCIVGGVAPLEEAASDDISFVNGPQYLKSAESSQAGVLLIKNGLSVNSNRTVIYVEEPQLAFLKILQIIEKEKSDQSSGVHPTAVVAKDAQIGPGVTIGPYAVIESGCIIGKETKIGAHCVIGKNVTIGEGTNLYPRVTLYKEVQIGNHVILHSGVVIGADGFGYFTQEGKHHKIPQIGTVVIEDNVEIGANSTVDRATMGNTVVRYGTKIDNLVQIAHNVRVGENCILASQSGVAGSSSLGKNVTLAGQVGVGDHVHIGEGTIIAAQSGIPSDVPAGSIVFGTPARPILQERKIQVIIGKLPKIYEEFRKIKKLLKI